MSAPEPILPEPFDLHAGRYAELWEADPSAAAQRARVHRALRRLLAPRSRVLDVGVGAGADAAWLLAEGHAVVGLDASAGMLAEARAAAPRAELHHEPAEALGALDLGPPFDAALLDFGVANAVGLRQVGAGLARKVRPGGVVVVVTMPRVNPAWTLGALRRGAVGRAVARARRVRAVPVEGGRVETTYRGPGAVAEAFAPWFSVRHVEGLGLALPPPGSRRDARRVARLAGLDARLGRLPIARRMGDHVMVVLERSTAPRRRRPWSRRIARLRADRAARRGDMTLRTVVLEVTSGCQSRCVGCGHRGPAGGEALTPTRAATIAAEARSMGARDALITGGEPLLRRDLDPLLAAVGGAGLAVTLLTNGLALRRRAAMVAARCDAVVVSLDGHDRATYAATRGVDGLGAVAAGVAALRAHAPHMPITARVTVTATNAGHLRRIVERARALGIDGVSFLAADTATAGALGRDGPVALPAVDPARLAAEVAALRGGPLRRFVTDSDLALDRLVHRARAAGGLEAPHAPPCDAPHTSAVVTADLKLRPCFFLPATGDAAGGLEAALEQGRAARAAHDVATHPTCARCVCWARLA